jgi:hypothetical protein
VLNICSKLLFVAQVLSFPSGRVPIFATSFLQSAYIRFVSVANTVWLRLFSAASLDCVFGKALPSYYIELIGVGFGPVVFGAAMVFVVMLFRSPVSAESQSETLSADENEEIEGAKSYLRL